MFPQDSSFHPQSRSPRIPTPSMHPQQAKAWRERASIDCDKKQETWSRVTVSIVESAADPTPCKRSAASFSRRRLHTSNTCTTVLKQVCAECLITQQIFSPFRNKQVMMFNQEIWFQVYHTCSCTKSHTALWLDLWLLPQTY